MDLLPKVVILLSIAVLGVALARRLGLLAPIVLVVAGLGLSFVPGFAQVRLDPELVVAGILPPLLYVAAIRTSVPAFRFNLRPILLLAVGLVVFTALVVGLVLHALLPSVPLPMCIALGAVVAPTDAVAATSVARRIHLPRRVVTILEGESLINDATALVMLRVSIAATSGAVGVLGVAKEVVVAAGGGLLVGAVGALVFGYLHARITNPLVDNSLSLLTPFLIVLVSEEIHASAVAAVVVAGLALGHRMPVLMSAASRLQMDAFWRIVQFLLEGVVFLLVGLQLRQVLRDLDTPVGTILSVTAAVIATLLITRFAWVYPATYLARLVPRVRRRDPAPPLRTPTFIAWAGMRGVVTLAAALALPETPAGAPGYPRALFVWLAFAVIVVTLVAQGITLPAVAKQLRLPADDPTADTLAEAAVLQQAGRAARDRLEAAAPSAPQSVVERLRRVVEQRTNAAWERLGGAQETPSQAYNRLRQDMIDAEREVIRTARDEGRIPEEVLVRAYRDLDLEESLLKRKH